MLGVPTHRSVRFHELPNARIMISPRLSSAGEIVPFSNGKNRRGDSTDGSVVNGAALCNFLQQNRTLNLEMGLADVR
jgi:hypothetical protein